MLLPEPPLVSVVVPAHNAGRHIGETIENVLDQSHPNTEVVVVDDGSTDDTPEVLKRFAGRIRVVRQANGGLGSARSAGMRAARGAYLAWLDADDLCHPQRIAVQAALLDARPEIDVVSTDFSAFDDDGVVSVTHSARYYSALRSPAGLRGLFTQEEAFDGRDVSWLATPFDEAFRVFSGNVWETIVWANFVHPPTVMMRRGVFERLGNLDDRYGFAVDWEYLIRASESSLFAYVDAPLIRYRLHGGQMSGSRNTRRIAEDILNVVEAELRRRPDLADRFPEKTRRLLARTHLRMAEACAESEKRRALRSFTRSLLLNPADRRLPVGLVRLLLPRVILAAARQLKVRASVQGRRAPEPPGSAASSFRTS
jgi:glycosyltransferase involved in cell wall biosynthesis